jgi:urease beta subunit
MKEELNQHIEILKKKLEMYSSISQIKISIKSMGDRVVQVENRVSGTED